MDRKLPEEQVKSVLAPWRFSLQSSGFESRLVTALELYERFPLDIAVTGGTEEANTRLADAVCGQLSEDEEDETDEEEEDDEKEDVNEKKEDEDKEKDDLSSAAKENEDEDEEEEKEEEEEDRSRAYRAAKVPKWKKTQVVAIARHADNFGEEDLDSASMLLHPHMPSVRIWTVVGGTSAIQSHYDVLVVLTTEIHQEDHMRIIIEQREKDKQLYLVKTEQEWDLVSEKPTGPCMTCAWERMRARNLELQKKHKLAFESGENAKESQSSSGSPLVAKLLGFEEIGEVLTKTLPELRKKAFSQFMVDITRELRDVKVPNKSTTPNVCTALKSRKISQVDLNQISEVFHPRDLTDQPSKLVSILTALEHFRLDVGLLGETGCGSSSLFNSLLGLRNGEKGAASIGVTETTKESVAYPYPECHNTFLWDLPGLGRVGDWKNQSVGSSFHQAPLLPSTLLICDVYILVSPLRLGLSCIRLLQHLLSQGKSCYLVLTKADLIEEKSIGEVRRWTDEVLGKAGLELNVFVVSALHPDTMDFPKLREMLNSALPRHKRDTLARYVAKLLEQDVFWKRADPCKVM